MLEFGKEARTLDIVLASASPRRQELLQRLQVPFRVVKSTFAEDLPKEGLTPEQYCVLTARTKGEEVWAKLVKESLEQSKPLVDLIISADSIVVAPDSTILEKAATEEEAAQMMRALSGKAHRVITGLIFFVRTSNDPNHPPLVIESPETTTVHFAPLSEAAIASYVQEKSAWDNKAGAYGIQDLAALFIPKIEGDYYNVMGFPLHRVYCTLRDCIEKRQFAKLQ
jgi:septum formation protein